MIQILTGYRFTNLVTLLLLFAITNSAQDTNSKLKVKTPNKLIRSTSPYLLQHAYNPVQWQEWGAEALTEAKSLDRPILVSIGYSSCHWCHVMERESFENEDIAKVMNENFICIKVDREERPDIDQIYMEAVQAMGGHGGWPLNVFLTPDQKPFYGGTYFPPQQWPKLLLQVSQTFKAKREEITQSAEELAKHLQTSDLQRFAKETGNEVFSREKLDGMFSILQNKFDSKWGGMDKAPKFVMPTVWLLLMRYHFIAKNKPPLEMVLLTLKQMTRGGLYDQLGGGFSRYSVDGEWFAPHFEKMLYDNAQLLSLYAEAYSITKDEEFKSVAYETVRWLQREMMHKDGGFYSALDADSEGVEGKFYTWTWNELNEATENESKLIADYFHCTQDGNWEHGFNILKRDLHQEKPDERILIAKKKMLAYREKKLRPSLDDKIIAGWNAMTVQGLIDCYKSFGDLLFLDHALKNISFVEKNLISEGKVFRAFKDKRSNTEGFLEDYAFLIQAYISVYEVTFDEGFLTKAERWTNYVLNNFYDRTENYFHFTSGSSEKLIAKKKEVFDNVIPSSNSVMARCLFHLGTLLDKDEWKKMASEMTSKLASIISSEPTYMSNWGILFSEITEGMNEVVITGNELEAVRKEIQSNYLPFTVYVGAKSKSNLVLMEGRESIEGETKIYVCRNKVCKLPVNNANDAIKQILFK
ncbi:MAG: thioredoxin domain-containing protein [Bacteroidetes bacterium]|nr:thioredoxin domain-containing protein [Bacteroidota bacterium]MBI3481367.1 thioredoxin domain-containing protein [Bacteroidota bacterium]